MSNISQYVCWQYKITRTRNILKTLTNHMEKISPIVNVRMSKITCTSIKVGVRTYATYTNCRTLTTRSCLLLRKEEIRPNTRPDQDLSMWRRPACKILSKTGLGYIKRYSAWVAPDLLKALAILSDATVRGSAVDQEELKP